MVDVVMTFYITPLIRYSYFYAWFINKKFIFVAGWKANPSYLFGN